MFFQMDTKNVGSFENCTVIIPSICVGNVAQLACDLLISSNKFKRFGTLSHSALIPIRGPSAYDHDSVGNVAACELYMDDENKLIVIQFRSPLIVQHATRFHQELVQLLKAAKSVIILSGSFGFETKAIEGPLYAYHATAKFKEEHALHLITSNLIQCNEDKESIFGGGNAMLLYKAFEEVGIPAMVLFRYLLKGDNLSDAASIISEFVELCVHLKLPCTNKLSVPKSWNLLFGNENTELLF